MAAPTLRSIILGVEARLQTITGLNTDNVSPDQINAPCAFLTVPPIDSYRQAMSRGLITYRPTVVLLLSNAYSRQAQIDLADYVDANGAKSIRAAIEGDRTLGGIADDCIVEGFDPRGLEDIGLIDYVGGVFTLLVLAKGA